MLIKAIQDMLRFKTQTIKEIDRELAARSIDENAFKTKEIREFVIELKKQLKGSPENLVEWFQTAYFNLCKQIYETLIGVLLPKKVQNFEDAKKEAGHLTQLMIDFVGLTGIIDVVATAFSATLIRNIVHIARLFQATFGLDRWVSAVIEPALKPGFLNILRAGWNAQFPTEIPSPSDLIRFVVRESFPLDRLPEAPKEFVEYMKQWGFDEKWARAYWWAHWELPARTWIDDALHRGIISEKEWAEYIKWHDYAPFPRPGISKSDIEILRGLRKELIPRVDIRRGWEYGLISDRQLVEHYKKLGYEDDAELMAEIQKRIALDAERAAIARAAGRLFRETIEAADEKLRKGEITEDMRNRIVSAARREFEKELESLKYPKMIRDLWIRRYEIEAKVKSRPWELVEEAS